MLWPVSNIPAVLPGLKFRFGDMTPVLENQMDEHMEHVMETGLYIGVKELTSG